MNDRGAEIDLNSKDFVCSLGKCSCDDNDKAHKVNMIESEIEAIKFDTVKASYAKSLGLIPGIVRSVDALIQDKKTDTIFFIEFKNGRIVTKRRELLEEDDELISEIKEKVRDSLLIYNDITNSFISDTRDNTVLIIVYNEAKNPDVTQAQKIIREAVMARAKGEIIRFKMSCFKDIYFKEVHTYTEAQFYHFLSEHFD